MLCSKCYQKIPEGEEVKKGSNGIYWRAGWWGGEAGDGGVFCVKCAKKEARREKRLRKAFTISFVCIFLFTILLIILSIVYGESKL